MNRQIKDRHVKQKNKSESITPEKPAVSAIVVRKEAVPLSMHDTVDGIAINFHSAEFNCIDDLNDCSGNYRTFQSLDGIVTADMRHQMERLRRRDAVDAVVDAAAPSKKIERERSEAATLDAAPPLTVISQGRTLIVDTDAERSIACGRLLSDQGLTCTLLITKKESSDASFPRFDEFKMLEINAVSITGAFGGFSATVTLNGDQKQLTEWFGKEAVTFDLVLDFQSTPSFAGDRLPMGYYAPGPNPVNLNEVMAELPEMRGRFNKPQFTAFLKNRCIHGRSRTLDCRQCLVVCPFGAIQSVDRTISIDHYRCQGCGGCAMVCPADAIQMAQPSQQELLSILRRTMEDRSAGVACPPTLVISDLEAVDGHQLPGMDEGNHDHRINFVVEQIGHVGLEMLLAALAYGAGAVVVACGAQNPPSIRKAAQWQAQMGSAILRGFGMPEDKIRFAVIPPENNRSEKWASATTGPETQPDEPLLPPATFSPKHDKRTLIRLATQHLYNHSGVRQPWIPLPTGSPFGAVAVDSAACTLCMACAVACPSGALSAEGDVPRLEFLESRCHQCRLCEEACPEGAMHLLPRMLCDPDAGEAPAVLNEAEPVRCIECGVPFASQAMINHIQGKLAGHWMYAAERQLRRLHMCRTCRTRDALVSQDMKSWNP
jgi:ferredoxin